MAIKRHRFGAVSAGFRAIGRRSGERPAFRRKADPSGRGSRAFARSLGRDNVLNAAVQDRNYPRGGVLGMRETTIGQQTPASPAHRISGLMQ
jgi:hypothetical protein